MRALEPCKHLVLADLPYISPISPLDLPYISQPRVLILTPTPYLSPISPLSLPYLSPISNLASRSFSRISASRSARTWVGSHQP